MSQYPVTYKLFANGYHIIHKYDKDFVRIFYHDSTYDDFFKNTEEMRIHQEFRAFLSI